MPILNVNSKDTNFYSMVGPKPVKVIAISSGKGGVGKSLVALNLSIALAKKNKKVLLFDGDLYLPNLNSLLGLENYYHLGHVLQGICGLKDILLQGPEGIRIVPGAFLSDDLNSISSLQYAEIINTFNELTEDWDYLIVDTAAGTSEAVLSLLRSSQEIVLVTCNEPASITDTYSLMKLMNKRYQWERFHILANMTQKSNEGRDIYKKLFSMCDQFLDVHLSYLGAIPFSREIRQSIKQQKAVVSSLPQSQAAGIFTELAQQVDQWPINLLISPNTSFFLERFATG